MTEEQAAGPPSQRRRRGMRSRSISELLTRIGAEKGANRPNDEEDGSSDMTQRERLARALWQRAIAGDAQATKIVLKYTEGAAGKGFAPVASGRVTFVFEEFVAGQARDDKS